MPEVDIDALTRALNEGIKVDLSEVARLALRNLTVDMGEVSRLMLRNVSANFGEVSRLALRNMAVDLEAISREMTRSIAADLPAISQKFVQSFALQAGETIRSFTLDPELMAKAFEGWSDTPLLSAPVLPTAEWSQALGELRETIGVGLHDKLISEVACAADHDESSEEPWFMRLPRRTQLFVLVAMAQFLDPAAALYYDVSGHPLSSAYRDAVQAMTALAALLVVILQAQYEADASE